MATGQAAAVGWLAVAGATGGPDIWSVEIMKLMDIKNTGKETFN